MVKNNSLPPASQPWVRELEKRIKNLERETSATHSRVNHLKNVTSSPKLNLDSLTVGELKVGGDPVVIPFLTGAGLMGWSVSGGTVVGNRISSTGGPITVSATMPDLNIEGGFVMEWALEASASVDSIRVTNSIDPLVEDAEPNDAMADEVSTYYASAGYNLGDIEGYVPEPGEDVRPPVPVMVTFTFTNPKPGPFTVEVVSSKASYTLPGQGGIQVTPEGDVLIVDSDGNSHPLRELSEAEAQAIIETAENLEQAKQELDDAVSQAREDLDDLDDKLGSAFPGNNIFDVDLAIEQAKQLAEQQFKDSVTGSVVEYSRNSNETNPPITGWSTTPPTRTPGTFIWMRTTVSYGSGDSSATDPVLLTGNAGAQGPEGPRGPQGPQGVQGPDGPQGQALYTWIKYAPNGNPSSAEMSESPVDMTHMGIAHNQTVQTEGNDPSAYSWSLIKGPQGNTGIQGPDGEDGQSLYTWVKYAPNGSPTASQITDTPQATSTHIGLAYNKTTASETTVPGDYTWSLIKGPKGEKGDKGDTGSDGNPGAAGKGIKSTAITYARSTSGATAPASGWQEQPPSPIKGQYLWTRTIWTYTDNATETGYSSAYWANDGAKGDDGNAGKDGTKLTGTVNHYAQSTSGTTHPTSGWALQPPEPVPGRYMWTRSTWSYDDGTTEQGYTVGKIGDTGPKGEEGPQGVEGPKGKDGTQYYTWLKYAPNSNPTSAQMTDVPNTNSTHMGMALNQTSSKEGTDPSAYTWSLIKGTDGVKGDPGPDGKSLYTWVKYAPNGSPTNAQMTDLPQSNSTHIGLAYNKTTATESTAASAYSWTLIQGPKGEDGEEGEQGVSVTSIAPHFRRLAESAAKPAKPSGMTPSGWSEMEPAYARDTTVWRSDRIVFSNNQITWTEVSKLSSYEAAKAAEKAALDYAEGMRDEAIQAGAHDLANLKIGGRNLLPLDGIVPSLVSDVDLSEYAKTGRVRVALSSSNGGLQLRFDSTGLGPNEDFVLSYKYRKLSGTLVSFGGHTDTIWGTPNTEAWVDGVKRGLYNGHSSVFVADDEEFHEVVVYGRTGNEGSDGSNLWIQPNRNQAVAVEVEILDLKLERGTKATDWTPAPEDVDAGIAGAIDALDVGGRNYMLNSAQPGSPFRIASNNSATSPIDQGTDEIGDWITGTSASSGLFYLSTYTNPTFESGRGTVFSDGFFPQPDVYTQSVEVMSEVAMSVRLGSTGDTTPIQPNVWTQIHKTYTPSDTSGSRMRLWGPTVLATPDVPVGTKLYLRNWKLGKGARATDWTPALEDVDANIVDAAKAEVDALEVGGRNLIIRSTETKGMISSTGAVGVLGGHAASDYIRVPDSGVLTLTKTDVSVGDIHFRIGWYDENKVFISRQTPGDSPTTRYAPEGAVFMRVSYPEAAQVKAERGTKATDWTPAPEDVEAGIADAHAAADAAGGVADKAWDSLYIHDTRDDNEPPSWYITNYNRTSVTEFKRAATVGLPSSVGTYVHVRTTVKWTDGSGGAVIQEAVANDGRIFTRHGAGEHWYDWRDRAGEAQAEALSAINMANGKNAASYSDVADSVAAPGPTPSKTIGEGRRVNDMHRNRRSNGQIIGEWIWTGTDWTQLKLSDAMLSSLDVGLLSAGGVRSIDAVIQNLWAEGLVARVGTFSRAVVAAQNLIPGIEVLSQYGDLTTEERDASPFREFNFSPNHPSIFLTGRKNGWIWANIRVRAGERYRISVDGLSSVNGARFSIRTWNANSDGSQGTVFSSWTDLKSSANTTPFASYPFNNTETRSTWASYWSEMTATADGVISFQVEANIPAGTTNANYQWFRNFTMRAMTDGNMLVDGAVTARTLNVVPDSGTGGMELKPEGLRIIPAGEDAGTAVSLRVGEENTISFVKNKEDKFTVNEFGDITGESLDVRGVLKENGVPLQEMLKALPRGNLGRVRMSGTNPSVGTSAARLMQCSILTPPDNRLIRITVSLASNSGNARRGTINVRQTTQPNVKATNSSIKRWDFQTHFAESNTYSFDASVEELGWPYNETITIGVFVNSGTAGETIPYMASRDQTLSIDDVGPVTELQQSPAYVPTSGGGSGGDGAEADTGKRYHEGKFYPAANMVQSYQGGNAAYNWNKSMLFHGYNLSANGRLRSMAIFNRAAVETLVGGTGTEMVSGHIKLYNSHTWANAGMTVRVGRVSNYTEPPGTWNGTTYFTLIGSYTVSRGGVLTIPLTSTLLAQIKSGGFRGIALVSNTNTASHYGYFNAGRTELYIKVRK